MSVKEATARWEEMLPHEFIAARDRFPLCWMAYGLAEPHGAYNALGLDWLKAYALVEAAAKKHGGIVAPPFAWHIQEIPEFHDDGKEIVESQVRNLGCAAGRLLAEHRPKDGWLAPNLNVTGRIADDFVRIAGSSWRVTFEEYRSGKKKYGALPDWNELERRES